MSHAALPLSPHLNATLGRLLTAYGYAQDVGHTLWDFAEEIGSLGAAGMTETDLRWLVYKGYAEYANHTTGRNGQRSSRSNGRLTFSARTLVVLTEAGAAAAGAALGEPQRVRERQPATRRRRAARARVPHWVADRGELRLGNRLVLKLNQPAPDQRAILAAFQEENWRHRIDDPLTGRQGRDAKRHLHEAISNLNRRQKVIQFQGDGTGQGICWRLRA